MGRRKPKRVYPRHACRHCGRVKGIAARGLCFTCRRHHRDEYPRLIGWHPLTGLDVARLRQWRAERVPVAECARRLGRTVTNVRSALCRHRIVRRRQRPRGETRAGVARLHAKGLTDRAIAGRLGVSRGAVSSARWLLGLPANREPAGRGMAACRRLYGKGPRDVARERESVRLFGEGWPAGVRGPLGPVLALLERGPATGPALAEALGRHRDTGRALLAECRRNGWVVCVGGKAGGAGPGRGRLWALAPAVRARREQVKAWRAERGRRA